MRALTDRLTGSTRQVRWSSRSSVAAAVAAVLATAGGLASMPAHADDADLQALKQQVQQLQQQIDAMQVSQAQAAAPGSTSAAPGSTGSDRPLPVFFAGPVKVTLGGFVELMVIDRSRNEAADWASNFNTSIPYANSHNYDMNEFHLTERQSRVSALVQGPVNSRFATEGYLETDFGGSTTNGNNNQSASFSPRVRHFYADFQSKIGGWYLLFGQTWSLVTAEKTGMMPRDENIPLTIDGQYVPGFDWLRVSQVRLVKNFNKKLWLGLSIENPAAQVSNSTTASSTTSLDNNAYYNTTGASNAYASTTNITTDYLPDVIAKVAADPGYGHYEVFGLTRWFRSRDITTGEDSNQVTHGYGFGGSLVLPVIPKLVDLQASFIDGTGVGRYGSAGEPDVTINPINGSLTPLHGHHVLVGLASRPTSALTVYGYFGVEHVGSRVYNAGGSSYGYGSDAFSDAGCDTEGSSACAANTSDIRSGTVGGWYKFYQGPLGNMQIGLSDTYVKRDIYAGVGGNPSTNINIALVSFRYYPFQP